MRRIAFFLLLVLSWSTFATHPLKALAPIASKRQYLVLAEASFPIHHIKARRGPLRYDPAAQLEIFNLLFAGSIRHRLAPELTTIANEHVLGPTDTLLVALSVLPNAQGQVEWVPIRLDTIPATRRLSFADVVRDGYQRLRTNQALPQPRAALELRYDSLTRRADLHPVIRREGRYWTPRVVVTEYYRIRPQPTTSPLAADNVTINTESRLFPEQQLWQRIRTERQEGKNTQDQDLEDQLALRYLLGSKTNGIYEFWSLAPYFVSHPNVLYFGTGSFRYKPGIGLVSAKYSYYFHPIYPEENIFFEVVSIDDKRPK